MIESAEEAAEKDGTLVHAGDCEQQWGSAYDEPDDATTRRRSTRQPEPAPSAPSTNLDSRRDTDASFDP